MTAATTTSQAAAAPNGTGARLLGHGPLADRILLWSGIAILGLAILAAIFAPLLAPYPADGGTANNPSNSLQPPSAEHWFGTDVYGRDVLTRLLFGARTSLFITAIVLAVAGSIGLVLGAIAGLAGGWVNNLILRVTDVFLALPSLLLCLAFSLALGAGLWTMILALALTWWPWYTRIAATTAASIAGRGYVLSARALGVGTLGIAFKHVLPNSLGPVFVNISLNAGSVSLASAGLAYLGLGAREPVAEWGLMVQQGQGYITTQPWVSLIPGVAIVLVALAFNSVGEGLRSRIGVQGVRQ